MKRILYLDCICGASGDMIVGSLLALGEGSGADFTALAENLSRLGIADEFRIETEVVNRCGIEATKFHVRLGGRAALESRGAAAKSETEPHRHSHDHADSDRHSHDHGDQRGHDHSHDHDDQRGHDHSHDHDDHHGHTSDDRNSAANSHKHSGEHHHAHRSHRDIVEIIRAANLPGRATDLALRIFRRIAVAEAKIHGVSVDDVHFHEVGAVDSIVDVVSIALLIDQISPDSIVVSPVPVGSGSVRTQHGVYPVPAPATAEILVGAPIRSDDIRFELTTPTGAAAVVELADAYGVLPSMRIELAGYGAGTKEFADRPNVLRAVLGTAAETGVRSVDVRSGARDSTRQANTEHLDARMYRVEVNLDDTTGEVIGHVTELLLAAGANDVYCVPIYMKKNRPATMMQVLCTELLLERVSDIIFRETTTFGLRYEPVTVHRLGRAFRTVSTRWGDVRVKEAFKGDSVVQRTPEFEDCRKLAAICGVPVRTIVDAARALAEVAQGAAEVPKAPESTEGEEFAKGKESAKGDMNAHGRPLSDG